MNNPHSRIHLLDSISQAKIKATVQILSLNDVVIGLVKNALDAQSRNIKVDLNYARGFCSVVDDGLGIPAEEFNRDGRLAQLYCTSKVNERGFVYGRHGRYLATLSGVALVCISSRSADDDFSSTIWCGETGRISASKESGDTSEAEVGTSVKIHNLFSKFPVRSKYLADYFAHPSGLHKEFEELKHAVTAIALAYPKPFEIRIEHALERYQYHHKPSPPQHGNHFARQTTRTLEATLSTLYHAGYIRCLRHVLWKETAIESEHAKVRAVISVEPMPHKMVQFISVNHEPLSKHQCPDLFQLVNRIFDSSHFGADSDDYHLPGASFSTSNDINRYHQPHHQSKGIDRWPMFVIWIEANPSQLNTLLPPPYIFDGSQALLARLGLLIETMMFEFLDSQGLVSAHQKPKQTETNPARIIPLSGGRDAASSASRVQPRNFQHWSRVKSSQKALKDDLITGLPFQDGKAKFSTTPVEVDRLPTEHESPTLLSDDTNSTEERTTFLGSDGVTSEKFQEAATEWKDHQTGRSLRINSRTGMILPDDPKHNETSFEETQVNQPANIRLRRKQRNLAHELSLPEVALSISRYSSAWPTTADMPIRSVALFAGPDSNHDNEGQQSSAVTHKLWRSLECCGTHFDPLGVEQHLSRISRDDLAHAKVLGQIDRKFILILIPKVSTPSARNTSLNFQLALVDQHAADERCKVETLLASFSKEKPVTLINPLRFEIPSREAHLLHIARPRFAKWHIIYEVLAPRVDSSAQIPSLSTISCIEVSGLPSAIAERCRLTPKLVIDLLREDLWFDYGDGQSSFPSIAGTTIGQQLDTYPTSPDRQRSSGLQDIDKIPTQLLDLINSRACRSAIMFNDALTNAQCDELILRLAKCTLPFQCAHGRPSMVLMTDSNVMTEFNPSLSVPQLATGLGTIHNHSARSFTLDPYRDRMSSAFRCSQNDADSHHINFNSQSSLGNTFRHWMKSNTA